MLASWLWLFNTNLVLLIYCHQGPGCDWLYTVLHDCSRFTNALVLVAILTMTWQRCKLCVTLAASSHDMTFWLGMFFSPSHQTADVLCTEVHKRREKVIRGERVDTCEKELLYIYTLSKMIMLFSCGYYESELCLRIFIPPILLKINLKQKQTEQNRDKHTSIWSFATVGQDQLDAGKHVQGGIECRGTTFTGDGGMGQVICQIAI
jgi:hypothetical protein